MKHKRHKLSDDYRQLKNKIFVSTLLMLLLAVVILSLLYRYIFFGRFANFVVNFLADFVYAKRKEPYAQALNFYQTFIRSNMEPLFLTAIGITFILIFRVYLNRFTRYFNEINHGIDALVKEDAEEVVLSPELAAIEKKINFIRHTLARRKADAHAAEQRKNDLIVYLAHDLKTPLTSVIGYLTLLADEPQLPLKLRAKYTGIALDKAQRLEDLINEFFDITRFNLTALTLERENTNLSRMLEQTVNEFEPILKEKELSWDAEIVPDIYILCDRDKLERVWDNLIRNAVNYSYAGGKITLSMARQDAAIVITVCNRGKTIPSEKLERIFEQFFRLDSARSSSTGGSGLGLAIAREIVELHGGSIQAQSENESITFTVRLPGDSLKEISPNN